jgi:hypothetical protein
MTKTVKQLKEELSEYPDDYIVVTRGYEGGFRNPKKPKELSLVLDYYSVWWMGPHEEVRGIHKEVFQEKMVRAIRI